MQRVAIALCLSLSVLAAGLASYAVVQSGSRLDTSDVASARDIRELRDLLGTVASHLELLESQQDRFERSVNELSRREARKRTASASDVESTSASDAGQSTDSTALLTHIDELAQRLAELENGETIARLATEGFDAERKRTLERARARISDPSLAADDRTDAFWQLLKSGRMNDEDLLSLVSLAQDTTLEPDLRAKMVGSLGKQRSEVIRQPLLDLLANDEHVIVRKHAMYSLVRHAGDPAVAETIRQISREDRHEQIQRAAAEVLPRVEHVARAAAERAASESTSSGGGKR